MPLVVSLGLGLTLQTSELEEHSHDPAVLQYHGWTPSVTERCGLQQQSVLCIEW